MPITKIPVQIGGFEILGSLGQGGMGTVYCVRDHSLQRDLAVKLQNGDWQQHAELMLRFLREARILAQINHPNVVQIYSVGEHEGAPFFAMELLESSIADAVRLKSPSIAQAKRWILEAARGLAAIHEMGVVHRDIKPANLLLTRPSSVEPEHVKVADLGIASAGAQFGAPLTRAGVVLGTNGYLAPEAYRSGQLLDHRADQYSLGVVFFELLAKRSPYPEDTMPMANAGFRQAPDVRLFRPELDAASAQILARMLADDPNQRFANTADLVQALARVQDSAQSSQPLPAMDKAITVPDGRVPAPPAVSVLVADRTAAPRRRLIVAVAAALLLGSALLWMWSTRYPDHAGISDPALSSSSTPLRSIDSAHREAWAKYLLGRYQLQGWNTQTGDWTVVFPRQQGGVLTAEFSGPAQAKLELTGRVESQITERIDGDEWDVYQVELRSADGRALSLRIEFSATDTAGEASYAHAGQRQRFEIVDSEDL